MNCLACGQPIRMMIFRSTGICSQNCAKQMRQLIARAKKRKGND